MLAARVLPFFYFSSNIPVHKVVSNLHSWNLYTNTLLVCIFIQIRDFQHWSQSFCCNSWHYFPYNAVVYQFFCGLTDYSLNWKSVVIADTPSKCRKAFSFYQISLQISTHFDTKRKWKGMREEVCFCEKTEKLLVCSLLLDTILTLCPQCSLGLRTAAYLEPT